MRAARHERLLLYPLLIALLVGCGAQPQAQIEAPAPALPTAQIAVTAPVSEIPIVLPTLPPATATPVVVEGAGEQGDPLGAQEPPAQRIALEQPQLGPGGLPYPLRLAQLNFGVVGHLYYTDRWTALDKTREAGFDWFRQQIHWRDIEDRSGQYFWADLDGIVEDAHARGVLVMLSVVRSPEWHTADGSDGLPADPAALARFVGALASHYAGKVQAIEIWNEQNLAHENGGRVSLEDAGRYVELLKASYESIKAVDPSIIVVAGAPSSTATNDPGIAVPDQDYLRAMYSYNGGMMRDYFDVQAVHPGGSANPPDTLWPDNPSPAQGWTELPTFYFRHVENVRRIMEEYGMERHQVWITEFGWATPNSSPGFEFGNQVSYDQQRDYIVGAIRRTYDLYPWVSNIFLWNLNFTVLQREHGKDPQHEQGSFSIFESDWTPRPAFYGIQQLIGELKGIQGR
jgi:hypothetical protein